MTADAYLSELSRHMKEAPKGAAYKASVFATFQLAMEQAEAEAPGARAVLTLAAFYRAGRHPRGVVQAGARAFIRPRFSPWRPAKRASPKPSAHWTTSRLPISIPVERMF